METGAIDITTGEATTQDTRTPEQRELLDDLQFAGNNVLFDKPGARDARRILGELIATVGMTRDVVLGSMPAASMPSPSSTSQR